MEHLGADQKKVWGVQFQFVDRCCMGDKWKRRDGLSVPVEERLKLQLRMKFIIFFISMVI